MIPFRYNSYHKLITGIVIIIWTLFHFTGENKTSNTFDNGQIKWTGGFSNGLNHGKWVWYYENGVKKMEGSFINGKRRGIWEIRDINGNKISEGQYENDKLNGSFIKWNSHGEIISRSVYKNDIKIQKLIIDPRATQ